MKIGRCDIPYGLWCQENMPMVLCLITALNWYNDVVYTVSENYSILYRLDAISQRPKNSRFPWTNPLLIALVMDLHANTQHCLYSMSN
jgi:hypothetical protein